MARLGITVDKSGWLPSWSFGANPRFRQTWTEIRSNVWPDATTTGSDIRNPVIGQRNSAGVSPGLFCGIDVAEAERWWWKENHLCLPFSPIAVIMNNKKKHKRRIWEIVVRDFWLQLLALSEVRWNRVVVVQNRHLQWVSKDFITITTRTDLRRPKAHE